MKPKVLLPALSLLLPFLALGETVQVKNHAYPERESAHGATWDLVGTHHYRYKFFISVFTGAYYRQENGSGERLVFTYTRDLKADDLREQAINQLKDTNPAEVLETYRAPTRSIQSAYEDVSADDSYAITVIPDAGIWLERDGEVVFHSDNAEFGDWYLDIWLGDPPIDKGLKKALMPDTN